jgi:hypothetical protein
VADFATCSRDQHDRLAHAELYAEVRNRPVKLHHEGTKNTKKKLYHGAHEDGEAMRAGLRSRPTSWVVERWASDGKIVAGVACPSFDDPDYAAAAPASTVDNSASSLRALRTLRLGILSAGICQGFVRAPTAALSGARRSVPPSSMLSLSLTMMTWATPWEPWWSGVSAALKLGDRIG